MPDIKERYWILRGESLVAYSALIDVCEDLKAAPDTLRPKHKKAIEDGQTYFEHRGAVVYFVKPDYVRKPRIKQKAKPKEHKRGDKLLVGARFEFATWG